MTNDPSVVDTRLGTVYETGGGVYVVQLDDGATVDASLRGRIKQEQRTGSRVVIGDRVHVSESSGAWTIDAVDDRVSELVRRGRGRRAPKILAANLDRVFVIVALRAPKATTQLIDRLLVLVESGGMRPMLVLNKTDLDGALDYGETLRETYESLGYRVFLTSAVSPDGANELLEEMCSGSCAFIGPSGAGKSSLLNAIDPQLDLRTGALSKKTGTGRHTTVGSRMIPMECGGLVADTPGFGDVGLWSVDPESVADCFPEFIEPAKRCRFRGCTHRTEPDCGVLEAMEQGVIPESRHRSYLALREEAEKAVAW